MKDEPDEDKITPKSNLFRSTDYFAAFIFFSLLVRFSFFFYIQLQVMFGPKGKKNGDFNTDQQSEFRQFSSFFFSHFS